MQAINSLNNDLRAVKLIRKEMKEILSLSVRSQFLIIKIGTAQ